MVASSRRPAVMRLAREEPSKAFGEPWSAVYSRDHELCWQKGCQHVASMGPVAIMGQEDFLVSSPASLHCWGHLSYLQAQPLGNSRTKQESNPCHTPTPLLLDR